jgi:PEP-CTERM motif
MFNPFNFSKCARSSAPGSSRLRHISAAALAAGVITLAMTMPTRADIIDTYTLSPGTTFTFNDRNVETATATLTVDATTQTLTGGTITLTGKSPEAGVYIFGEQTGVLHGFTTNGVEINVASGVEAGFPGISAVTIGPTGSTGFVFLGPGEDNFILTTAVPEPSTWAMMILGFLGVGFMAYRRRNRAMLAA